MIIDELKKENMVALKEKDSVKRAVLSVVINKYMVALTDPKNKEKGIGDTEVVAMIQKTIKEVEEEKNNYLKLNRLDNVKQAEYQINILKSYLPKMLSKEEILTIISTLPEKTLPVIMKHFKANYAGKVDMALVLEAAKEIN